jgi:DNA-binding response OmpR family regulator
MKRVLVVDDEIVLAQVIGEFLEDEGYGVMLAHRSRGILQLLERERPDLVFLDVMMPDGDGRDIVKEMQSRPDLKDLPVVMMSAGVSLSMLNVRVRGFLRKPFDIVELLDLVNEVIGPAHESSSSAPS